MSLRILFCCRPAYGHVYPLLPLATACRDAGHRVLFATGEGFRPRLRDLGVRAERVGISIDEADRLALREDPGLNALPREERWRFGVVVFGDVLARRTLEDLRSQLEDAAPDLVVYDETDVGAAAAARLAGVPAVAHSLGRQVPDQVRRAVLERLAEVARGYDVEALPADLFEANAYLDICPPSLQDNSVSEPASGSRSVRSPRSGRRRRCPSGLRALVRARWSISRSAPTYPDTWIRCGRPRSGWACWRLMRS
jgi:hypothetical protein